MPTAERLILVDQEDSGYVFLFPDGERVEVGLEYDEIRKALFGVLRSPESVYPPETGFALTPANSSGPDLATVSKLDSYLSGPIFVTDTKPFANLQAVMRQLRFQVYYLRRTQLIAQERGKTTKSADVDLKVLSQLWYTDRTQFKELLWVEEDFLADAKDVSRTKLEIQQKRNKTQNAKLLGRKESAEFYEMVADMLDSLRAKRVRQLEKKYTFLKDLKVDLVSVENTLNLIAEAGLPNWFDNEWKWLAHLGLTDRYSITKGKVLTKKATKQEIQWLEIHKPMHAAAMRPFSGTYGAGTKKAVDEILRVAEAVIRLETNSEATRPLMHKRQAVNRVATRVWTNFYRNAAPILAKHFGGHDE